MGRDDVPVSSTLFGTDVRCRTRRFLRTPHSSFVRCRVFPFMSTRTTPPTRTTDVAESGTDIQTGLQTHVLYNRLPSYSHHTSSGTLIDTPRPLGRRVRRDKVGDPETCTTRKREPTGRRNRTSSGSRFEEEVFRKDQDVYLVRRVGTWDAPKQGEEQNTTDKHRSKPEGPT